MSPEPRPELSALSGCEHGGLDHAQLQRLGIKPEELIDFSVNSNPFGPPAGLKAALSRVPLAHYPDSNATEVRRTLADKLGVLPKNMIAGSGSIDLLRMVSLAFVRPGDAVLLPQPTFGEYELACKIMGAKVVVLPLKEKDGFRLDVKRMAELVARQRPRLVFLCNPNNPTGEHLEKADVEALLQACGDSLLVLDEAYVSFVDAAWSSTDLLSQGNLLILRSMTKDYALAGLRLGYAVGSEKIIDCLNKVRAPWNVNALAQQAALIALASDRYLAQSREKVCRAKLLLEAQLRSLGFSPLPSCANFLLVKVGDARKVKEALLKHMVLVRDCASFGLPEYIRIAVRRQSENRKLIDALRSIGTVGAAPGSVCQTRTRPFTG